MDAWHRSASPPRGRGDSGPPLYADTSVAGPRPPPTPFGFPAYREESAAPPLPPNQAGFGQPQLGFEMHLGDGPSPFSGGLQFDRGLSMDSGFASSQQAHGLSSSADEFAFGSGAGFPALQSRVLPPQPPPRGFGSPAVAAAPPQGSPLYHLQYQQHLHQQQQQQQQQQPQPPRFSGGSSEFSMGTGLELGQSQGLDFDNDSRSSGFLGQSPSPESFDLSKSMLDLNLSGSIGSGRSASPGHASSPFHHGAGWDTATGLSMRDQMNQQMAALYQQSLTPERSSLAFQNQPGGPLAQSGNDLLSLLNSSNSSSFGSGSMHDFGNGQASPLSLSFSSVDGSGSFMGGMQGPPPHHPHSAGALTPSRTRRSPAKSPPSHHFRPPRDSSSRGELPSGNAVSVSPDFTKPNDNIKVQISLKAEECTPGRVLMVGLFRLGQLSNEKPIFVKQVLFENKLNRNYRFLNTRITFRSPRSPGEFEFRVFEDKKGESGSNGSLHGPGSTPKRHGGFSDDHQESDMRSSYSNFTIARSNRLKVCMEYNHFIDTLRATNDKFNQGRRDGDAGVILSALLSLLRLIDQVETVFLHGHALFGDLLDACLRLIAMDTKEIGRLFPATDTIPNPTETFHGTMRNVLNAIQCNPYIKELISDELLAEIEYFQHDLYCQVSGMYFLTKGVRRAFWREHFGFEPVELPSEPTNGGDGKSAADELAMMKTPFVTETLSAYITREAEQLIPDRDAFVGRRNKIFGQLRTHVIAALSFRADLDVFGSSANDFGNEASDMDMCLVLPPGVSATVEEKQHMLLEVVALLEVLPDMFTAIDTSRLSARIPIIMFTSKEFGIECDLCVENALALRNTSLLRAYANADDRVRVLAYTLKQFVKRRRMNCAAEGTLSSYGYLLMLIHFLQRQDPPILPVLQSLPRDWNGESKCDCTPAKVWCPVQSPTCRLSERREEMQLPSVLCKGPSGELDPTSADAMVGIETYFYDPFETAGDPAEKVAVLHAFGKRNTKTVGELWLGFLHYFGLEFDASKQVVSVRMARTLSKEEKKRTLQWRMHTRLSIEDPFEVSYDVAHVLKGSRDKYIRQQFVRAYSLVMQRVIDHRAVEEEAASSTDVADAEHVMQVVNDQVVDVPFLHPHGLAHASSPLGHSQLGGLGAAGVGFDLTAHHDD